MDYNHVKYGLQPRKVWITTTLKYGLQPRKSMGLQPRKSMGFKGNDEFPLRVPFIVPVQMHQEAY